MNHPSDHQRLLNDVLAESSPADFRAALLGETLRFARRRRIWRRARAVGGALAVAFLAALFARPSRPELAGTPRPAAKPSGPTSYHLVETRPLPARAVVATGEFTPVKTVSSFASVAQVATTTGGFRLINDEQLLALFETEPAILIRTGPNSEELVFADPAGQDPFLGN